MKSLDKNVPRVLGGEGIYVAGRQHPFIVARLADGTFWFIDFDGHTGPYPSFRYHIDRGWIKRVRDEWDE